MKDCISLQDLGRERINQLLNWGWRFQQFTEKSGLYCNERISLEKLIELGFFSDKMFDLERELVAKEIELRTGKINPLAGIFFSEASTRTWGSNEETLRRLGFDYRYYQSGKQSSTSKGESIACTIRTIVEQQLAQMLIMRLTEEGAARFAAEIVDVPIINAGDGRNRHPTQGLLDLLAIAVNLLMKETGVDCPSKLTPDHWQEFTLGLVGDMSHSRVAHSLFTAAGVLGFKIGLVCGTKPPESWLRGVKIVFRDDEYSKKNMQQCDVLYLLRLQKERLSHDAVELERAQRRLQITPDVLDKYCRPDVLVMHAQPIDQHGGTVKLFSGTFDDSRLGFIRKQANCGVPMRMAVILMSWLHRNLKRSALQVECPEPLVLSQESIDDHFKCLAGRRGQYLKPLKSGVVMDHIPPEQSYLIKKMLNRAGVSMNGPEIRATALNSNKMPAGKKDILMLEGTFPPNYVLATIQMMFPSVTFNICREGIFSKQKFPLPPTIPGILPCPNPNCICNSDPEAVTRFNAASRSEEGFDLSCSFCERYFEPSEVLQRI